MQVMSTSVKSSRNGSFVTVNNEGSGVIEIDRNPKSVVHFTTDNEFEKILRDVGLNNGVDEQLGTYDLTDAISVKNIIRLASSITSYIDHRPLIHIGVESPIILKEGESTTVPIFYWGDGELSAYSNDPNTIVTVNEKTLAINRLSGCKGEATIGINISGTNNYSEETAYFKVAIGHRYGFRIDKKDSNPQTRVSYLYDAVGFTPAHMDYALERFNYGSWWNKWFITDNKPLMLKSDGTVDYYLNQYDYTLKENGDSSDVTNIDYDGNAMVQIPLVWLKLWEDGDYEYCIISDVKFDDDYKAYAYTRADGSIADYLYYSIYEGSGNATKIRSLSGQTCAQSLTAATEIAGCQANGNGWFTHTWSQRTLLTALLVLLGKSTNTQAIFGNGNCRGATNNSGLIKTGTLDDKGLFYGFNTSTQAVKVFGIENFWGNQWDRIAGLINNKGAIYVKMTPEGDGYRINDVNGYTGTGLTAVGPSSGGAYIKGMNCSNYGFIPNNASGGSATTYYCDACWANNGQLDYLLVGGSANHATSIGGSFTFDVGVVPSYANWHVGCGLSYV